MKQKTGDAEKAYKTVTIDAEKALKTFFEKWKNISLLGEIKGLLGWDQDTMIASGEVSARGEQAELIARMKHKELTDPELHELTQWLYDRPGKFDWDPATLAGLKEALHTIRCERALPAELVAALAKHGSRSLEVWQKARKENDWNSFAPYLTTTLELMREKADWLVGAGIGKTRYESLLLEFERGFTLTEVDATLGELRRELPPLVHTALRSVNQPDTGFLFAPYPVDVQERVCREIITAMGFDWTKGRMDVSAHPFTTNVAPSTARITNRYDIHNLSDALYSAIHEAGHALYEQGIPSEWGWTPIGTSGGMALHESQSRFWEVCIGRSMDFSRWCYGILKREFPNTLKYVSAEDMYRAVNMANVHYIRCDSDPLTYNLHIVLRYEMEKSLISGELAVTDAPEAWNRLFEEFFGCKPPTDREGILQDVHWARGLFGYFPSYTMGNIIAEELYGAMQKELTQEYMGKCVKNGDFRDILNWLRTNVHRHGRQSGTTAIVEKAIGKPISASYFLERMTAKYKEIYNF